MAKGEIAHFVQFLLVSLCFQKAVCCRGIRKRLYERKGFTDFLPFGKPNNTIYLQGHLEAVSVFSARPSQFGRSTIFGSSLLPLSVVQGLFYKETECNITDYLLVKMIDWHLTQFSTYLF